MTTNKPELTQQAIQVFSIPGYSYMIDRIKDMWASKEYADNVLSKGGLDAWEAKEWSEVSKGQLESYVAEVERMNAVAEELAA